MKTDQDTTKFREEMIQVAAVATAIVEDIDYGEANAWRLPNYNVTDTQAGLVLGEVGRERVRQDAKWGPQTHTPIDWLMILMEEVGEAAEEVESGGVLLQKIMSAGRTAKRYLEMKFGM